MRAVLQHCLLSLITLLLFLGHTVPVTGQARFSFPQRFGAASTTYVETRNGGEDTLTSSLGAAVSMTQLCSHTLFAAATVLLYCCCCCGVRQEQLNVNTSCCLVASAFVVLLATENVTGLTTTFLTTMPSPRYLLHVMDATMRRAHKVLC